MMSSTTQLSEMCNYLRCINGAV